MFYTLLGWAIVLYIFVQIIKEFIEYFFPLKLHGKIVVVIGSTTGFGHEFVLRCARQGMTVFAACNSPNGAQKVLDSTSSFAGTVHAHQLDLASRQSVEAFFQFVNAKIGDGQGIDALVNNAGIIRAGPDDWLTLEDYETVFRVNMFGIIDVTKKFKEKIKLAKGNYIKNKYCNYGCLGVELYFVQAFVGRLAFPFYGPYTMSKFAMEAYGDTIRRELAPFGVSVAIVEPGYFRTPITDPNNIPSTMESAFRQAPSSIREQYGEQFLMKIKSLAHAHLASAANSSRVDWVIDVYFHACTARFPRKRYVVGLDANWIVVPIARLPAEIQDFAFWLNSLILGAPIPNALKPKSTED